MNSITPLKTFDTFELLNLLRVCAQNLAMAYQETQERNLFLTAQQASLACDYLMYQLQKQQSNQTIH